MVFLHIEVLLLQSCGELLVGGRWPYDPTPAPLVREEIGKSFLRVLEVSVRIQDIVGRAGVEGHNSILTVELGIDKHTCDQFHIKKLKIKFCNINFTIPLYWKLAYRIARKFGSLYYNHQIKIRQNFLLAYIRMAIPYWTAKLINPPILL